MAGAISITLQGEAQTVRVLESLPVKIQERCLGKAVNAGAGPYLRAARANAPRQSGLFVRTLALKVKSYARSGAVVALIGQEKTRNFKGLAAKVRARIKAGSVRAGGISRRGDAVPIHLVESPTKPHRIPLEFRKVRLRITTPAGKRRSVYAGVERSAPLRLRLPSGQTVYVDQVQHPGTRGSRFLGRAYEASTPEASARFESKLAEEVDREATSGA